MAERAPLVVAVAVAAAGRGTKETKMMRLAVEQFGQWWLE
jgi:hypothetical protein